MKTKMRAICCAIALSTGAVSPAFASGIPVVDVAGIAQMVQDALQQAQEAADQLAAMERDIEQARQQFEDTKEMITGNSGYGSYLNSSELYSYLPTSTTASSWEEIYSSMNNGKLNSLRNKFGLTSEDELQQEVFDVMLTNYATLEASYKANNLRLENIQSLQALADSAQTPQEKDDIQARIAVEQAAIANETNRLASVESLMEKKNQLNIQRQNQKFEQFLASGE